MRSLLFLAGRLHITIAIIEEVMNLHFLLVADVFIEIHCRWVSALRARLEGESRGHSIRTREDLGEEHQIDSEERKGLNRNEFAQEICRGTQCA